MELKQKQKIKLIGFIPAILAYVFFGIVLLFFGTSTALYVLGSIVLFYSVFIYYAYFRTKHVGTLISAIYVIVLGILMFSIAPEFIFGQHNQLSKESISLLVLVLVLASYLLYLSFNRKLKWRGKEILKLAAQNVEQSEDSYTERPLPTGKVDFTRHKLEKFAKYFEKNLLGLTYREDNRIVFMPLKFKNEYFALYNPNYNYIEKTWVAISNTGDVSVNISKEDYLDYKADLAFNQLCSSLSDLTLEFIELYIDGREVRIIDQMDNLKINVFI
ncbi:MAG: hypothetical protein QM503_11885 [Bacteroidota bacterium]